MPVNKRASSTVSPDQLDDLPELTEDMLDQGRWEVGGEPATLDEARAAHRGRGRPKLDHAKQQVSIRLDPDVLARLKAMGPGWQVRVNEILRRSLEGL